MMTVPRGIEMTGTVTAYGLTMTGYQVTTIDRTPYATLWKPGVVGKLSSFVGSTVRFIVTDDKHAFAMYGLPFAEILEVVERKKSAPFEIGNWRSSLVEDLRHGDLYRHPERYRTARKDAGIGRLPSPDFKTARGEETWVRLALRLIEQIQNASNDQIRTYWRERTGK